MTAGTDNGPSIVVAGGGTAGHIEPALAVADAIRTLVPGARITALGTERGLEGTLVPQRGYDLRMIPPVPVPRKVNLDLVKLPFRVLNAVRKTRAIYRDVGADAVIGFGGYVSAPAYPACRAGRKIPFAVHEANARAGLANKLGTWLGGKGLAAVSGSGIKAEVVGIPVRSTLSHLDRAATRAEAREYFGLPQEGPVLFVTGGSQGARSINDAVSAASEVLTAAGVSVLHAHGRKNTVEFTEAPGGGRYVAVPYIDRMDLAYSAADLAVCRSGAMTVAEVSATGLPAVYVPLPHGNGEQALNASAVVSAGGGVIVDDSELSPRKVEQFILPMLRDPDRIRSMSAAAASAGSRDAARTIARRVLELAGYPA